MEPVIEALPGLTGESASVILSRPKGDDESLSCKIETFCRFAAQVTGC